MTISGRLMALGLGGSASVCVLLSTQVSATVPPEEARRLAEVSMPICTPEWLDLARDRAAAHMRQLALVDDLAPADDYTSGLALIERSRKHAGHKAFIAGERDLSLRTLAMCGQPTTVDRCVGYRPPPASWLAQHHWHDGWEESEREWRSRLVDARREAELCPGVAGPPPIVSVREVDCSDVPAAKEAIAVAARRRILDRTAPSTDPVLETFRVYEQTGGYHVTSVQSVGPYYAAVLAKCGESPRVDICAGYHDRFLDDVYSSHGGYRRRTQTERERREATLCAGR